MRALTDAIASIKALVAPSHKYSALPEPASSRDRNHAHAALDEPPPRSRFFKLSMGIMLFFMLLFLGVAMTRDRSGVNSCIDDGSCTHNSHKHWGPYSPWFPVKKGHIKTDVPSGCEITVVSVLSRHGSRFPTDVKSSAYKQLVERIQTDVKAYGKGYEFIRDYEYAMGVDDLTPYGEQEMVKSGRAFFKRYAKLVATDKTEPFIRASGSDRVVESAKRFAHGFFLAKGTEDTKFLDDILVIPEGVGINNTLNHGACIPFEVGPGANLGWKAMKVWRKIWATPIMERLNSKLPGANLNLDETVYFMDLCPFNTVASDKAKPSQFCHLFSKDEWHGYDYYQSLTKWYGFGPANPLGPTQGVGYVNELIARLTRTPVNDHTSSNSTLDSDAATFPLDRHIYADFSHDNAMMTIYSALGLYTNETNMPLDRKMPPEKTDGYSASWTLPFGARMYVEKMTCGKASDAEMVRVLVNDRVVPPRGCKADKLGMCRLDDFLDGLSFAKNGGHWDRCEN